MSSKEVFFVQTFDFSKKKLVPGPVYKVGTAEEAKRKAEAMSERKVGVVAFSQIIDDMAGFAEEPTVLALYGHVPPEADQQAVA